MKAALSIPMWIAISLLGAAGFAALALHRGETVNAAWMLTAALCTYAVGYRFYSRIISRHIYALDDARATPAVRLNDGHDYVPTDKWVTFGHHFAAIAGPGPLLGPILAAQFGYLPGTIWIIVGVVLGGAVQDLVILCGSIRRDGKSLGQMAREEIGPIAGWVALLAVLGIVEVLIAVLAIVIVNALADSPWGTATIALTIPIALFMGIWMRVIRPGRVLEASVFGLLALGGALWFGHWVNTHEPWRGWFTLSKTTLAWAVAIYGFTAAVLPVWVLLAPRDYLSAFVKIGTIGLLALGIFVVLPELHMPKLVSSFADGTDVAGGHGPVFAGRLFPFAFITIACGAISGFHALVASGTTPKLIARESHAPMIGYGAMLMESFVAVMAMIAACALTPGIYFAINCPPGVIGSDAATAAAKITSWGAAFAITPDDISALAKSIGEDSVLSRVGGAPTLAVGMAQIFAKFLGGAADFWYHFAIMFEALFILTTLDAGTRVARFMLQGVAGQVWKPAGNVGSQLGTWLASAAVVAGWGYFLAVGVSDPLGVRYLWPIFGIANQSLAVVALCVGTTIIIKLGKARWAWITILPLAWLATVTQIGGWQQIFSPDPALGFLARIADISDKLAAGALPVGAKTVAQAQQFIFNARVDAALCGAFLTVMVIVIADSARECWAVLSGRRPLHGNAPPQIAPSEAELREG